MADFTRGLTARIIREGSGEECVFKAEHNFYCYLANVGGTTAMLQVVLQKVQQAVTRQEYETGADFEESVLEAFQRAGALDVASFSCVLNQQDRLFLLTRNLGEVYIQRGGKTLKLLTGNKYAVGRLQDDDTFLLTTSSSSAAMDSVGGWSAYLDGADISGHDLSGLILTTSVVEDQEEPTLPRRTASQLHENEKKMSRLVVKLKSMDRHRLLMFAGLGVIALLLVTSLIVGLIRRANDKRMKQIAYAKEEVAQKLQQAEDVAFLNTGRAAGLINDAKQDVTELKEQIGGNESKEIREMNDLIKKTESTIFKKEEKQPEEFFDLAIEDKNAKGKLISRAGDHSAIVDPNGNVYLLNLEKKSIEKVSSGVKDAVGIALGETSVFVVGTNGVVQIDGEGKSKKVLEKDTEWGTVSSVATFNNNLYILGGNGSVFKYVPTEGRYGGKSSYIKGSAPNLSGAKSIAIDSSVYVAVDSAIYKFAGGLQEGFSPQFPEGGISITKIDTSEDVEKVYVWDKPRGLLFVISKNGSYERQIKSAALKTASDVVVTKDTAYLLNGQKIYKIDID